MSVEVSEWEKERRKSLVWFSVNGECGWISKKANDEENMRMYTNKSFNKLFSLSQKFSIMKLAVEWLVEW